MKKLYSLKQMGLGAGPIFDDRAWTCDELRRTRCESNSSTMALIRSMVASGEWEQVWKRVNGRKAKAYRATGGKR